MANRESVIEFLRTFFKFEKGITRAIALGSLVEQTAVFDNESDFDIYLEGDVDYINYKKYLEEIFRAKFDITTPESINQKPYLKLRIKYNSVVLKGEPLKFNSRVSLKNHFKVTLERIKVVHSDANSIDTIFKGYFISTGNQTVSIKNFELLLAQYAYVFLSETVYIPVLLNKKELIESYIYFGEEYKYKDVFEDFYQLYRDNSRTFNYKNEKDLFKILRLVKKTEELEEALKILLDNIGRR